MPVVQIMLVVAGIFASLIVLFVLGLVFREFTLWLQAFAAGAVVSFWELIAMQFRKVNSSVIVLSRIQSVKAGIDLSTNQLETHYLARGRVPNVVNAMIAAEELGITSKNAKTLAKGTKNPEINRLLGNEKLQGREAMGLSADWALNVISQVGNYGEVFEANLGPKTALGIQRGHNAQWRNGGLIYAPPFR